MKEIKGICAVAITATLALTAIGAGPASADSGDTYYLSSKATAFVSFVVRDGSDEASALAFGATKIPCNGHPKDKTTGMLNNLQGTAPIVDGVFKQDWSPISPPNGYVKGTAIDAESASGVLRLRMSWTNPGGAHYDCATNRKWKAKSVSQKRWDKVRWERAHIQPSG